MARPVTISVSVPGRAWQRLRQMYVDLSQKNDDVYSRSSLLGLATIHCHLTQDYAALTGYLQRRS